MIRQVMGSGSVGALLIGSVLATSAFAACSSPVSCHDTGTCGSSGTAGVGGAGTGGNATGESGSESSDAGAGGARDLDAAGAAGAADAADAAGAAGAAGAASAAESPALILSVPPTIRVRRGSSADVNVSVARTGGSVGKITVMIDGLPAGVAAGTLSLDGSQSAGKLRLNALPSAAIGGPIAISVTAVDTVDGALSDTASATFFVAGAPAEADESFGVGGTVMQSFTTREDQIQDLAIDGMDRIVLAGAGQGAGPWVGWAARLLPNGALDPKFGVGGKLANFGPTTTTTSVDKVAIVGDKVVFSIYSGSAGGTNFLRKFSEDGTVDSSFGTGGDVILTDGLRVLLHRERGLLALTDPEFKLYAYTDKGAADTSFVPPASVWSIAVTTDANERVLFGGASALDGDFTVTRLTANGSADTTFGKSGIAALASKIAHTSIRVGSMIALPDGRSVFLGDAQFGDYDQNRSSLFRLDSKGALDATFGMNGEVLLTNEGFGFRAILQDDGKLVALYADRLPSQAHSCAIARFGEDGKLDPTFAASGVLKLTCPKQIYYERAGNRLLIVDNVAGGVELKRLWL